MPTKPPKLKQAVRRPKATGFTTRTSRQARGYGVEHLRMRALILIEEPLCRECLKHGRAEPTTIADHIAPKAEGGSDDRSNYQGLCHPCHVLKTAREAARARRRPRR